MKGPGKRIEVLLLLFIGTTYGQQYLSTTIAGGGLPPTAAPALTTPISAASGILYSDPAGDGGSPTAVAWSTSGLYFAADNCIFKLDRSGLITRIAGASLLAGYAGDGGQATHAYFNQPEGLALDSRGNLFVADSGNHVIRKISPDGIITTVAGTGVPGRSGDGGPATEGALQYPRAVAVDGSGNVYIADSGNYAIRKVAPSQVISTVSYKEDPAHLLPRAVGLPYGLAVGSGDDVFFTDSLNSAVHKISDGVLTTITGNGRPGYSGDGGPATNAQLNIPTSIAVTADGTVYVADSGNHAIRKITKDGEITTVAGTGAPGFVGDGGPASKAKLNWPVGITTDPTDNLYIADEHNSRVRSVTAGGTINTVAGSGSHTYLGDGGLASAAQLDGPRGAAFDASGSLYISDWNSRSPMA